MSDGMIGFAIVFGFLQVYAALAAIDFGAGGLYLLARLRKDKELGDAVIHYMSPVWETTGVFLICFLIGMVGFFPGAVDLYSTALIVPATVALALMVVRGVAFTHAHHEAKPGWLTVLAFGLSSVLIPVFLGPFFTVTEVGMLPDGQELHPWTHPLSLAIAVVGLAYMWALSSTFLSFWVQRRAGAAVSDRFARLAVVGNVLTLPATGALLVALKGSANYHYESLVQLWPIGIVIGVLAVSSAFLVRRQATRAFAFISSFVGFVAFFAAYGWSRMPYLIYPHVTVESALTSPPMFTALVVTLVVGLAMVVPALVVLAYFAIRGSNEA